MRPVAFRRKALPRGFVPTVDGLPAPRARRADAPPSSSRPAADPLVPELDEKIILEAEVDRAVDGLGAGGN